jgi:hypothetical protein
MSSETEQDRLIHRREANLISRREAIQRVTAILGGIALVGGDALLTGCGDRSARPVRFTEADIAFLDEIAETILPETNTPGARAAGVGSFMALMVTDSYEADEQEIFREGMRDLDERCRRMHDASFMEATPEQRIELLQQLDLEQKRYMDARRIAQRRRSIEKAGLDSRIVAAAAAADSAEADAHLPGQRQENDPGGEVNPAAAITGDAPPHYFRMMKELALLGYFTSEIGYTEAMRYVETPGRFDPCVPFAPGEKAWAPHA